MGSSLFSNAFWLFLGVFILAGQAVAGRFDIFFFLGFVPALLQDSSFFGNL